MVKNEEIDLKDCHLLLLRTIDGADVTMAMD